MGFFSRSFDKPGPGVDPDAPQKRSFFRFFEILWRKLSKFCQANLIYSLMLIPSFIIIFILASIIVAKIGESIGGFSDYDLSVLMVFGGLIFTNLFISVMGAGPATAGISYIMRNFAREEHAWVWSDFKDEIKANFKQALAVFVIDLVMVMLFYVAVLYYSDMQGVMGIMKYIVYVIIVIYALMHLYIYPLMVTFRLSVGALYRNALLFTVAKLPSSIFVLLIQIILHIVIPVCVFVFTGKYAGLILAIVLLAELLITQAVSAFLTAFNAYPKMKKYMLDVVAEEETPK